MSDHDTPEVGSGRDCHGYALGASCACRSGSDCPLAPASPVPVQPADAGEGLSEAERGALSAALICRGDVYATVERILAARTASEYGQGYDAGLAAMEADVQHWRIQAHGRDRQIDEQRARAESAEARLANVEARLRREGFDHAAGIVRDALTKPATKGGQP